MVLHVCTWNPCKFVCFSILWEFQTSWVDLLNLSFKSTVWRRRLRRSRAMCAFKSKFFIFVHEMYPIYTCYNLTEERYPMPKKLVIDCQVCNLQLSSLLLPSIIHRRIHSQTNTRSLRDHLSKARPQLKLSTNLTSIKCSSYAVKYIMSETSCKRPTPLSAWQNDVSKIVVRILLMTPLQVLAKFCCLVAFNCRTMTDHRLLIVEVGQIIDLFLLNKSIQSKDIGDKNVETYNQTERYIDHAMRRERKTKILEFAS